MRKNNSQIQLEKYENRQFSIDCPGLSNNGPSVENLDKVAHDVRGAINVITCYAQIMLDEVDGKINAEQRQALQDMLTSGNHLNDLMGDILKQLENELDNKR